MDARESYERDGFVFERGFLRADVLGRLTEIGERVHAAWMNEHGEDARRRDLVNSTALTSARYFGPPFAAERFLFFDALASDGLVALVSEVFGDGVSFHGTQMFFNPVAGARRPYWHRDIQYGGFDEGAQAQLLGELCALHIRLPLRPERGFMLVPGSHARWDTDLEREVRLERSGHRSSEDLPSAKAFDVLPGDVLVFSANMLHRGTYAGNQDRLSLDLMVGKPHPLITVTPDPDQLPTPDELARLRNPRWYRRAHGLGLKGPD
jgi:ectoine hydroxylase-related dioxygenase (phytanoyl-CoA dioxygenase family)